MEKFKIRTKFHSSNFLKIGSFYAGFDWEGVTGVFIGHSISIRAEF